MKKRLRKGLSIILVLLMIVPCITLGINALSWNGSSTGGGGGGSSATVNGYAIRTTDDNCIGYRFSIVNKYGANKVGKVIDIFRNTEYGEYEYYYAYKFDTKYNKKQIINNQDAGFSTSQTDRNCYLESEMNFATCLPTPDGMGTWQNYVTNLNRILTALNAGSIANLKNGDKILVEPLYDVKIEKIYHAVTVSEIAIYGKYLLGAYSDGGASYYADSWGFISEYVNKHYPNSLYTTDGMGLWDNAYPLPCRASFYTMINTGFGVGIAYVEKKSDFSPALVTQTCEIYGGSGALYGTSNGYALANYKYYNGYPQSGDSIYYSVTFCKESENCLVRQSVWIDGVLQKTQTRYSNEGSYTYTWAICDGTSGVPSDKKYYTVTGRTDWIDENGNVLKYGTEQSFYIPIRPSVYRNSVTAYNLTGKSQAYATPNKTSGKVYIGQKIYTKYQFTSTNRWTSYNNLYAAMNYWKNGSWSRVSSSGTDMVMQNAPLATWTSQEATSSLGYIRVPDNRGSGSNVMRFKLTSSWVEDVSHTTESNWIDIPVCVPDVELYDMYIADKNGNILDFEDLTVAEKVFVHYKVKNNTECTVFVEGYNDTGFKIDGIFEIASGKTIDIEAYSIVVPNQREFDIWGGVYLEGTNGNASIESNAYNNTMTLKCKSRHPVTIVPIVPNAPYREETKVISGFYIKNCSYSNYVTSSNLKVRFTVSDVSGKNKYYQTTKNVVVPAKDKNLIYYSWDVPKGLNSAEIAVSAEILDDGLYYNSVSNTRKTVPFEYYSTPNTTFEDKAPSDFKVTKTPDSTTPYTIWWEYECNGTTFKKKNYGIGIGDLNKQRATAATGQTAKQTSSKVEIKSGYGISVYDPGCMYNVAEHETPEYNLGYTPPQYAYALFPEYNYENSKNTVVTMKSTVIDRFDTWIFPSIGKIDNVHYTPIWYPDGNYDVVVVQSDCWTPIGMLTKYDVIDNISIKGNAYDDWYVGRGG